MREIYTPLSFKKGCQLKRPAATGISVRHPRSWGIGYTHTFKEIILILEKTLKMVWVEEKEGKGFFLSLIKKSSLILLCNYPYFMEGNDADLTTSL